jgi:hypothetical protein
MLWEVIFDNLIGLEEAFLCENPSRDSSFGSYMHVPPLRKSRGGATFGIPSGAHAARLLSVSVSVSVSLPPLFPVVQTLQRAHEACSKTGPG